MKRIITVLALLLVLLPVLSTAQSVGIHSGTLNATGEWVGPVQMSAGEAYCVIIDGTFSGTAAVKGTFDDLGSTQVSAADSWVIDSYTENATKNAPDGLARAHWVWVEFTAITSGSADVWLYDTE